MATNTDNYKLIKPGQDDFYNVDDFNTNADIIDAKLKEISDSVNEGGDALSKSQGGTVTGETNFTGGLKVGGNPVETKAAFVTTTLAASGWQNKVYSFASSYPSEQYNIEIGLNSTATTAQFDAFSKAKIVGSSTGNTIKALGTVPTVDIPIILKAVKK